MASVIIFQFTLILIFFSHCKCFRWITNFPQLSILQTLHEYQILPKSRVFTLSWLNFLAAGKLDTSQTPLFSGTHFQGLELCRVIMNCPSSLLRNIASLSFPYVHSAYLFLLLSLESLQSPQFKPLLQFLGRKRDKNISVETLATAVLYHAHWLTSPLSEFLLGLL
jgi:hypothetical protein